MLEPFYLIEKLVHLLHESGDLMGVLLLVRERALLPRAFFLFAYGLALRMSQLRRVALGMYDLAVYLWLSLA